MMFTCKLHALIYESAIMGQLSFLDVIKMLCGDVGDSVQVSMGIVGQFS